jgi:MurNAc alpha-1-phosphate uridylyltransferase
MLLAAGRGERMEALTKTKPKPLLEVKGKPLIVHLLESLKSSGFEHIIINTAYLGEDIQKRLDSGSEFGVNITYSPEGPEGLETGGGIFNALPLLGDTFLVVNADIWTDYHFDNLPTDLGKDLAHLVLVDNPSYNSKGDFKLDDNKVLASGRDKLTFSGIAVYHKDFFAGCTSGKFPVPPLMRKRMRENLVSGEHFKGLWCDVGTPDRLRLVNESDQEALDTTH